MNIFITFLYKKKVSIVNWIRFIDNSVGFKFSKGATDDQARTKSDLDMDIVFVKGERILSV